MNDPEDRLEYFQHALISPLTALHGAVALLQRDIDHANGRASIDTVALLERGLERLRRTIDLLIAGAVIVDQEVRIRIPVATFRQPDGSKWPVQPANEQQREANLSSVESEQVLPLAGGTILLITAEDLGEQLDRLLQAGGYTVLQAYSAAIGLDLARGQRPAAIVLDAALGSQVVQAAQILADDPDTKMIPLMVCNDQRGPVMLPGASNGMMRRLFEHARPPEALLSAVQDAISAGLRRRRTRQRILVVDDEADIGLLIAAQLQSEECLIVVARSGAEALQIAQQQEFDLILLDLMLPDIHGFTVLGGLRAQPQTTLTPIILISALNAPHEKVRGLELGADDYITKPFSAAELQARVQAALRRSEREGGANPSTRLPGNQAIERAINQRIETRQPFAVCYIDLDNFKAYNDSYGFFKGDAVILRTAHILTDMVREWGNADDFVGHIGGDDFVVITSPARVEPVCHAIIDNFDQVAPLFYDPAARLGGYIEGFDRQGQAARFPIVSVSIAVVSSERQPFSHPGEVAQRSIELKKRAKQLPGSAYVVE